MKFINIPKNGASWGGELCYSFATELDQPSDVVVIVRDADTNEEFGRMRLYSVIGGTVDIAPAVRRKMSREPPSSATPQIIPSRAMCRVIVEVEGVRSPTITLFRASYNPVVHSVLSSMSTECGIASGDTLRFTLNVVKSATITVVELTGLRPRQIANLSYSAQSQVVEVVLPITNLSKEAEKVVVSISNGIATDSAEYRIVERTEGSRKLLWYNANGGIESRKAWRTILKTVFVVVGIVMSWVLDSCVLEFMHLNLARLFTGFVCGVELWSFLENGATISHSPLLAWLGRIVKRRVDEEVQGE